MTNIRISVTNTSDQGGTFLTPLWFAAHDENFDLYDRNVAASPGLEALAEDGNFAPINAEVVATDADAVTGAAIGAAGPIATGETTSATFMVDGANAAYLSVAAMILPSNDAFIGTGQAVKLFDDSGNFMGAQTISFDGSDVLDAGTEVNTEEDAAFLNQMGPNTGVTENGVVTLHPGFLAEGTGNILGGTNAFGGFIDPIAADFTQPGAGIAEVHINEYVETTLTNGRDVFVGSSVDDLVQGGSGADILLGKKGWDEIEGGDGKDLILGGAGNDIVSGGAGRDNVRGGRGDDTIAGGEGNDRLHGGRGEDVFVFGDGDGRDRVNGFNEDDDMVWLDIEGVDSFEDVLAHASNNGNHTVLNFGDGDVLVLRSANVEDLSADNFAFG